MLTNLQLLCSPAKSERHVKFSAYRRNEPEQKACIIRGRTITRQGNDDSIFCAYPSPEIAYYKENVALNSDQE